MFRMYRWANSDSNALPVEIFEGDPAGQSDNFRWGDVLEARGCGLMLGLELVDPATGEPNPGAAAALQRAALRRGLIVELGGREDAVVRMLPPLNVTRRTIEQALAILQASLLEVSTASAA